MTLSNEQIAAIRQGDPVRVAPPEIGADCIVLRADIYDRVSSIFDDGLSGEQVGELIGRQMHDDDANDPLLDTYQQYRR